MSGICGFIGDGDKSLIKEMARSINHRGGKENLFIFNNCGFGVTASIRDKTQAFGFNDDGSICVILDGEICNKKELLGFIKKNFGSNQLSDPEMICFLYERYGVQFIEKIIGTFAFALWDITKNLLVLGRDRLGEKPLCYYKDENTFLFSSEIKSFLQYENFTVQINYNALNSFLTYLFVPTPHSIFKGVYKLSPGNYLVLDNQRIISIAEYWDFTLNPILSFNEDQVLEKMDYYFTNSIKSKISNKDKIGVFLSGGIDSNIVASKASRLSKDTINTFTLGFDHEKYNELDVAKHASEYYGTRHHDFQIGADLFDYLPDAIWYMEEPHGDSGLLSLFYISKMACDKGVFRILTGDGGDELFWGYPWNLEKDIVDHYFKIPRLIRNFSHLCADTISRLISIEPFNKVATLKKYEQIDYPKLSPQEKFIARTSSFVYEELSELYSNNYQKTHDIKPLKGEIVKYFEKQKNITIPYLKGYVTMKTMFLDNGLFKGDRMTAAFSIDAYHPLLDGCFVDFSMRIPSYLKIKNGVQKYIWRKYAQQYNLIPKQLFSLKKTGFGIPLEYWLKKELKSYFEQEILEKKIMKEYFDKNFIKKLFKKCDQYENVHRLFSLLSFSVWYDKFLNN
jgi:asparagine synthase (glutamine-hydrolysing)